MADGGGSGLKTPLFELHRALGGKLVPFAGYLLPVQYPTGILAEHLQTRSQAGLFDVSHMGQVTLRGPGLARRLEALLPGDIQGLAPGRTRYSLLLNGAGGAIDDLMVTRPFDAADDRLSLVVNAARKEVDVPHLAERLGPEVAVELLTERALLALQGPAAAAVMADLAPGAEALVFLSQAPLAVAGIPCLVSRSGYSGEDGFEISVAAGRAMALAEALLKRPEVKPAGLGARDSLRLEAGLCLYGHELDETTSPIEADLAWTLPKRRRAAADFPGAARILQELERGPARRRVGLAVEGRAPVREGAELTDADGTAVGRVTSGGFGPTVGAPIAMGYVARALAVPGTRLNALVRGKPLPVTVAPLPFVPTRYRKA